MFELLHRALRMARAARGMTQGELASKAGVTQPMLSSVERGGSSPTLETLEKILEALGMDLADLDRYLMLANEANRPRADKVVDLVRSGVLTREDLVRALETMREESNERDRPE